MFRLLLATLALGISVALAEYRESDLVNSITWRVGDNMVQSSRISYIPATRTAIYENFAFLAFQRELPDAPITLARMNMMGNEHKQDPFPNLEMQKIKDCRALQNVVDLVVDHNGLLWVLDSGLPKGPHFLTNICEPKIVALYPLTGKVIRTIDMSVLNEKVKPLLRHIVVGYNFKRQALVYVSDVVNKKIFRITESLSFEWVKLPKVPVVDRNKFDITINLLEKSSDNLLVINDEEQEKVYYLKTKDFLPDSVLKPSAESSNLIILGNDHLSTIYFSLKNMSGIILKLEATGIPKYATPAYTGNLYSLPIHVVPDYKRRGVRLLLTNKVIQKSVSTITQVLQKLT